MIHRGPKQGSAHIGEVVLGWAEGQSNQKPSASQITMLSSATRSMGMIPCRLIDGISYSTVPAEQLSNVNVMVPSEPGGSVRSTSVGSSKIPPDVIYIDPMYPERKKSALVKKEMQILQRLHGEDDGNEQLLALALRYARKRVVVKRPINAEILSDIKPNTSVRSKKTRYDIYTIEKM